MREEREATKINALIERESLLRKIKEMKERNKLLTFAPKILQYDAFGDLEALRTEEERLLQDQEFDEEGPVIRQVQSYAPLPENNEGNVVNRPMIIINDKGKQKMVGTQKNKPVIIPGPPPPRINKEIELERKRKEDEALAQELERVEIDAAIAEKRRKIQFFKASSANL